MKVTVKNKWLVGTIVNVENFVSKSQQRYIRFTIKAKLGDSDIYATSICRPIIIPGKNLYNWLRVANVPLDEVNSNLRPSLFIGKSVKIKVTQNEGFYNVVDFKPITV